MSKAFAPLILGGSLVLAAFVACSDDDPNAVTPDNADAGDAAPPLDSAPPPQVDANEASAAVDCSKDRDADGLAKHLECAGLYSNIAAKTLAADARPFTPAVQFWSDGAEKRRWVQLPANMKIDTSNMDEWKFPIGTRFWKEFKVDGKRIETRLFEKLSADQFGFKYTTYRWNAAETEAVRTSGKAVELVPRANLADGAAQPPYEVPTDGNCNYCHAGRAEPVLGFEAVSLGLAPATPLEPGSVTLATLVAENLLTNPPTTTTLTIQEDATAKSAAAMGWLHANCGHCHNSNLGAGAGGSNLKLLLSATKLIENTAALNLPAHATGVCKPSERDAPGGGKYLFIAGTSPSTSLASILLGARSPAGMEGIVTQMPPVVSHQVDTAGEKLVNDWISALPVCP
jgi:hypothetical protein